LAQTVIYTLKKQWTPNTEMSLSQEEIIHGLLSNRTIVLAYIRSLVVDRDAAEDIHQEVVIQALRAANTIEDGRHLLAWARRTAKLKSLEYLRGKRRQPLHLDPDVLELLEPSWETESSEAGQARVSALSYCLGELTPRARELVKLRFVDRLNGSQISNARGLKIQSVYMSLSRIYHTLENCMRRKLAGGV
jgi:RNA polymerase sigma-70 factor, ECF subfamily